MHIAEGVLFQTFYYVPGHFISTTFLSIKKDSKLQLILNVNGFNKLQEY